MQARSVQEILCTLLLCLVAILPTTPTPPFPSILSPVLQPPVQCAAVPSKEQLPAASWCNEVMFQGCCQQFTQFKNPPSLRIDCESHANPCAGDATLVWPVDALERPSERCRCASACGPAAQGKLFLKNHLKFMKASSGPAKPHVDRGNAKITSRKCTAK